MQNLGTLDNEYTILSIKSEDAPRIYYTARNNQNQNNYIIEIKTDPYFINFPAQEINVLKSLNNLNCPYILRYIRNGNGELTLNNQPPRNEPYIVYENASKFNLFHYLRFGGFQERLAKLLFKKILIGVQAFHDANICHRDIKIENILLDENYNPKIIGLYSSCINGNNLHFEKNLLITHKYASPELFNHHPYDGFKDDIFSLGQLLIQLVTRVYGFDSSKGDDHCYELIKLKQYGNYWHLERFQNINVTNEFKNLFVRMVAYDPSERPTIVEILNSQWMQEINNLNDEQLNNLENEVRQELHNREL